MSIFREYDIRGVVGKDLTEPIAQQIGVAFGTRLKEKGARVISIARDGRLSSPALFEAFSQGISSAGIEVLDIGICPTPLLYFSLFQLPVDGGAMITGSHNPAEYNGFKLCIGHDTIHGEEIQHLGRIVKEAHSHPLPSTKTAVRRQEIIPIYHDYIVKQFTGLSGRGVKVVLDSGNATAGLVAPAPFPSDGL